MIDDDLLDEMYEHVREYHRTGHLVHAITLGGYVVKKLYGGTWREGGNGEVAVRTLAERLAQHRPLSLSSETLYRFARIYDMDQRLDLRSIPDVALAHATAALRVPRDEQRKWLVQVEANGWNGADMVRAMFPQAAPTVGVQFARACKQASKKLDKVAQGAVTDVDRAQVRTEIDAMIQRLTELRDTIEDPAPQRQPEVVVEAAPAAPDHVLTATEAAAKQARATYPYTAVSAATWIVAGLPAPDEDDVRALFRARAMLAPDSPWAHEEAAPPWFESFLDGAERGRRLELCYGGGVAAQLDLCVAAHLVLERPALAQRTFVVWDEPVPLLDVAPLLRDVWRAFHAGSPVAWAKLRERDLPGPLGAAVRDWLAELPHLRGGVGATQRALLQATARLGAVGPVIRAVAAARASVFHASVIEALTAGLCASGALEGFPDAVMYDADVPRAEVEDILAGPLRVTALGDAILEGRAELPVEDRWWGGTHLTSASEWRWDADAGELIPPAR